MPTIGPAMPPPEPQYGSLRIELATGVATITEESPLPPAVRDGTSGNLWMMPWRTRGGWSALVFGGVVERWPAVNFCLCRAGGFLPYQAGRFLHAFDVRAEPKTRLRGSPRDSLARLHYDTIVHSSRALEFLIATAGAEHVLLGSDYPFDMGELDCVARVEALPIAPAQRDAVLGRRAGELLRNARA